MNVEKVESNLKNTILMKISKIFKLRFTYI